MIAVAREAAHIVASRPASHTPLWPLSPRPMQTGVLISLGLYFAAMLGIGIYAWRKSTADSEGYLLAGRDHGNPIPQLRGIFDRLTVE